MLLAKSSVAFAQVALAVCEERLPLRRSKHARRDYSWPQLVACLLVRSFLKLDYRGLEIRLGEHAELRRALRLSRSPDHTAFCRALGHLGFSDIESLLDETIRRLNPKRRGRKRETLAIDSTGLRYDNASRSYLQKSPGRKAHTRNWPKWSIGIDVESHAILSHVVARGPRSDHCEINDLLEQAQRRRPSKILVADAGFDGEGQLRKCRSIWKLKGVIRVAPRGRHLSPQGVSNKTPLRRRLFENFPWTTYRRRKQVESTFSAHKRRFGDVVNSKTTHRRCIEQLLRAVLHNCAILQINGIARTSQQSYPRSY